MERNTLAGCVQFCLGGVAAEVVRFKEFGLGEGWLLRWGRIF